MGTINNFKKDFYWALVVLFIIACFVFVRNGNKGGLASKGRQGLQMFAIQNQNLETSNIQYIKIAGQTVKVDLALTPEAQAQGLSGRKTLGENEGMLFVFDQPGRYSFWMKNMNFPIDIIWLNENLRVIFIEKNLLPTSYPQTYTPLGASKYVLEVQAGFAEKNNLEDGDSAQFLP